MAHGAPVRRVGRPAGRRLEIGEALADAERGHTRGTAIRRLRHALVIAQLALSVVLPIGAGLLGRSFKDCCAQDAGFRRGRPLTITLSNLSPVIWISDEVEFADPSSLPRQALIERLLERLRAPTGVVETGVGGRPPMAGREGSSGAFLIVRGDEIDVAAGQDPARSDAVPRRYGLRTCNATGAVLGSSPRDGHSPVRGRLFDERDSADAPHVALISESLGAETMAERRPDRRPHSIRRCRRRPPRMFTIVGIVGDIREGGSIQPRPTFYADTGSGRPSRSISRWSSRRLSLPSSLVADARRVIQELSPEVAPQFRAIDEVRASVAGRRFALGLTSGIRWGHGAGGHLRV